MKTRVFLPEEMLLRLRLIAWRYIIINHEILQFVLKLFPQTLSFVALLCGVYKNLAQPAAAVAPGKKGKKRKETADPLRVSVYFVHIPVRFVFWENKSQKILIFINTKFLYRDPVFYTKIKKNPEDKLNIGCDTSLI